MKSSPVAVFMYNVIDVWMQPNKGRILCGGPLILTLVEEQDWRHSPWGPSPASHSVLGAGLGRVQFWKFSVAFHFFFFFFFFLVSELQVKHRGPFCLLCFLRQLVNNHYVAVFLGCVLARSRRGSRVADLLLQGLQIYCCVSVSACQLEWGVSSLGNCQTNHIFKGRVNTVERWVQNSLGADFKQF